MFFLAAVLKYQHKGLCLQEMFITFSAPYLSNCYITYTIQISKQFGKVTSRKFNEISGK